MVKRLKIKPVVKSTSDFTRFVKRFCPLFQLIKNKKAAYLIRRFLVMVSLNRLSPRILVGHWAVLELLAAQEDILIVLLAVLPELLVVYAVATCTLQGLHG